METETSKAGITWHSHGARNCKGNTGTYPIADGALLETTCDSCSLRWTMPNKQGNR